jgi:D-amino-acid oxidase
MRVTIIGCGVSGLSTGIRLLEAGHDVSIWARDLPPNTTSNIAAAIWHPYKAFPVERVVLWGQCSFEVYAELAHEPESGVSLREAIEIYGEPVPDPWWRERVSDFRPAQPEELPPGYAHGFVFLTPLIETPIYLRYLVSRFEKQGGRITRREVRSLGEALSESRVVVNCSGLGARALAGDDALYPIRGQIVRVEPPPIARIMLDEDETHGVTYIVPRSTDCILGGTAQVGNWSLEPDMPTAEAIFERCARLAPEVRACRVVEHLVGLRPGRPAVRLEAERQPGGEIVVHNYGHGGAGLTLSWGCAEEVAGLVAAFAAS